MKLTSSAFEEGDVIPPKYTCDGEDVNPELRIDHIPEDAKSLALIVDDPDATRGVTWDHWIVWNIDPQTAVIKEHSVPANAVEGMTSFGRQKYGGPCPPKGSRPHRYMFKLYALSRMLDIPPHADKNTLEKAMDGHIIDTTVLMGVFSH